MSNKKLLVTVMGVLLLGLALSGCAANTLAQGATRTAVPAAAPAAPGGSITVVGQGTAYGEPDQATVTVGVETFAPTVVEATADNQAALAQVMAALDEAGIAPEDIQTTNYSLFAEQIYGDRGPEGIAGYRVSNQVNVKIRDIDNVGAVLAGATEAGANAVYGVNFAVADPAGLEEEARAAAVADAQARAASLAGLAGLELGGITVISEVMHQPVMPFGAGRVAMEQTAAAPGIAPGQLGFQVQLQVTYAVK